MNWDSISLIVSKDNIRADLFLSNELLDFSRSRIKRHIELGLVKLNGTIIKKAGHTLKAGDQIEITIEELRHIEAIPENIPLDIIYEDDQLAVINKPQGMSTHPAPGSLNGTLVNAILYSISDLSSINGVIRPGIVHRLDKNTSGLIVIAKTDFAHKSLSTQISEKSAQRIYWALVDGNIKQDNGTINAPIARSKSDRKKMAVVLNGRNALTHYKIIERFGEYTLVEFALATGRTHQIRVHANYIKHPVVGDATYSGSNKFDLSGQLLHAKRLILTHPTSNEKITFESELPPYFVDVLNKIRAKCNC
ncbi:MAG: RluA family pseudouridine synthase [Christensenellaceae bacterium]|jgi:23S rRNA pseudouridine1911/1915/1917 synthase|nr:RluA family pseudouridine synthase [Christensenellaceae bacterium]